MLKQIQDCFRSERLYYTGHAREEMEFEEFGEIKDAEVFDAVLTGKVIEMYQEDEPYPSCLITERPRKIGHFMLCALIRMMTILSSL